MSNTNRLATDQGPTNRQLLQVLDAKDACLRRLSDSRTKGRFDLYLAVTGLYECWRDYHYNRGAAGFGPAKGTV